jgi:L-threonylcarbamoyladenylate synthase
VSITTRHCSNEEAVGFPTEPVYGLGADATNADAVRRIFAAKGRPPTNPLIAHVADAAMAKRYTAAWPPVADALAAAFWPGPLTLVLPKHPSVADEATAGLGSVGVRVPGHPLALELLRAFGGAVAAPSANRSNRVSPTTAQHVRDELGDAVDLILDGGPCAVGIESTVLDLTGDVPTILRPGGVSRDQLESVLGAVVESGPVVSAATATASPGQHAIHYSPVTPTIRFESSQRTVLAAGAELGPCGMMTVRPGARTAPRKEGPAVEMPGDPQAYARHLYAVLRELDGMGLRTIYVEMPPDERRWSAVRDRLRRAAKPL